LSSATLHHHWHRAKRDDAADEGTGHLRCLAEAFRNLKQHSPKGGPASLCLRVAARMEGADGELTEPDDCRSWRAVWDAALRIFNVTMAALIGYLWQSQRL